MVVTASATETTMNSSTAPSTSTATSVRSLAGCPQLGAGGGSTSCVLIAYFGSTPYRLHPVELALERVADHLGRTHGVPRGRPDAGDLHDRARDTRARSWAPPCSGCRRPRPRAPAVPSRCSWRSVRTWMTTDWSAKRVYGLSAFTRPSAGSRAISSAVGGAGGLIRT